MRIIPLLLLALLTLAPPLATAEVSLPSQTAPASDRTDAELAALAAKYTEGARRETMTDLTPPERAGMLLAILDRVSRRYETNGPDAIPREDLVRIAQLHEELKPDLTRDEGYKTLQDSVSRLLEAHQPPPFALKYGIDGFVRGEGVGNFRLTDFAFQPGHAEGRVLYRTKPYFYWHPTDWLDIHLEGQGFGYSGGSQDLHRFSLYQGFVAARIPGSDLVALRGGRQEITYGSSFILGNDPFIKGRSYDGGLLRLQPVAPLTVDLFWGAYATPFSQGVTGNLGGGYATWSFGDAGSVDLYALRDTISGDRHSGENRQTWGLRGTARVGGLSLEVEPVLQTGKVFDPARDGNDSITAFGGHLDLDAETTVGTLHNHVFLSYAIGSGSHEAAKGGSTRREFTTPLNDSSLMGDMKVIGDLSGFTLDEHHASGLQAFTVGWGADLLPGLNFSATGRYYRALHAEPGFSRDIGLETDFTLAYTVNDQLTLTVGYDRFFTGRFFRDATGRNDDIHYGWVMAQFNLSRSVPGS